jgi:hypothetical protein
MFDNDPTSLKPHEEQPLRQYLGSQLDGQLGKSQERFRQFLSESKAAAPRSSYRIGPRFGGWFFSVAGAAIAACLGFLAAGLHMESGPKPAASHTNSATNVSLPWMATTTDQQDFDGGVVVDDDGQPMRVLQRRTWQRTQWFDDKKELKAESVVPEDQTVYVKMNTY